MKSRLLTAFLITLHLTTLKCFAAETSGGKSTVVATVLGKKISAADVGLQCGANNKPVLPADTPSTCLLRNPLDELQTKISREVARDYIEKNNLTATDEEVSEFQKYMERSKAQDRIRRQKKLEELDKKLKNGNISSKEKERRATLLSLAAHDKREAEMNYKPTAKEMRSVAEPWIEKWKFNKSIYEKYGGTVGITKFGPEPVGSVKRLLEDYEKQGKIVIHDENLRREFWKRLSTPPKFTAKPDEIDFTPYWKKPIPKDKEYE